MREIRRSLAVAFCAGVLVWANDSFGQASTVAEKLFRQAVDYMQANDFASACPLLDRSYQLDPKDGTLQALADCRDHQGKLTLAVGHYRAYLRAYEKMQGAVRQKHKDRAEKAEARVAEIDAILPKVKFVWETPPDPESKIVVDGVEFRASSLDVLLPLDPGEHKIIIQLPGEPARTRVVTLAAGGSTIVDLTPAKPHDDTGNGTATGPKPVAGGKKTKLNPTRIAGFVGLGLGAAGILTGGITGILAFQQKDIVDARCNANYVCDPVGFAAVDRFKTLGTTSTISFIAGGVFAGAGLTLFLVSRRAPQSTGANVRLKTLVLPGATNFSIEGAF